MRCVKCNSARVNQVESFDDCNIITAYYCFDCLTEFTQDGRILYYIYKEDEAEDLTKPITEILSEYREVRASFVRDACDATPHQLIMATKRNKDIIYIRRGWLSLMQNLSVKDLCDVWEKQGMSEEQIERKLVELKIVTPERQEKAKRSKYNAKILRVDGMVFRSQLEANYYQDLKIMQRTGEITGFCMQPEFLLMEGTDADRAIRYKADFIVFYPDGRSQIIDTKGYETSEFKRTKKMFRLNYPHLELKVVKS